MLQNSNTVFETSAIVSGNLQNEIILNLSKAPKLTTLDNVKISLRSLDESVNSCSLLLYDVVGYSEKKSTDELKTLIENEREKIKQEENAQSEINHKETMFLVAGIILFATLLGVVLVMLLRRNGRARIKD